MDVLDVARIMIYRMHEKGLEIFLIKPQLDNDPDIWKLPQGYRNSSHDQESLEIINLDSIKDEEGKQHNYIAVEGDWHDIPSIRGIIKHDFKRAKRKIKELLPDLSNGSFVSAKMLLINYILMNIRLWPNCRK